MNARRLSTALAFLALGIGMYAGPVVAQEGGTVTGMVIDADTQQPLAGAQVVVSGTNRGTLTNQAGRYLIPNVPAGSYEVRVVIIGFSQQTQDITVTAGGTAVADFELSTSAVEIDGITVNVITGETQRARELGTNNSVIGLDDIAPAAVSSLAQVLSGRSEGVTLNAVNGAVGTSQRIRIRGANSLSLSNEPLIYVDGIQFSNDDGTGGLGTGGQEVSRLNDLNPNDIESIEVLKGPAATGLYGTQAANGVLLITTKKGKAGRARWNFYAEGGQSEVTADIPANYRQVSLRAGGNPDAPLLNPGGGYNSTDYTTCRNYNAARGLCTPVGAVSFNPLLDARTSPFSDGKNNRFGANVAGGDDRLTYFLSGEYQDQQGVEAINTNTRSSFRANMTAQVTDEFNVGVNTSYTKGDLVLQSNDNSSLGNMSAMLGSETFWDADPTDPYDPVTNRRNYFSYSPAMLANYALNQEVDRALFATTANYRPLSWLSFNGTGGLDYGGIHSNRTLQPNKIPASTNFLDGTRTSTRQSSYVWTANASAVAGYDINDWINGTTTLGGSYYNDKRVDTNCNGVGLLQGTASCGTVTRNFGIDENFFQVKTVGFYGQQEFGFNDRIFASVSVRADDNSAFGADYGLEWYPNASLSWVLSEEDFYGIGFMPELRVRGAFGTSGLRPNFRDAVTLYSPVSIRSAGGDIPGVIVNATGNPDLKPERTTEFEFGFDAGLFSNKVGVDFTYYNKKSSDALISRQLPPSMGLTANKFDNLGQVTNSGTETSVRWDAYQGNDFGLNLQVAYTTISNNIDQLSPDGSVSSIIFNRGAQRHEEGNPAGSYFQVPYTYADANGDGLISADEITPGTEAVYKGQPLPTSTGSFSFNIRGWDWLNVTSLFEMRNGATQLDGTESFRCTLFTICQANNDPNASLETQAAAVAGLNFGTDWGYMHKADFVKWRELAVTLTMPQQWQQGVSQLSGLSVTFSGRNLVTWSDYPGLDPEINETGGSSNFSGSEFLTMPPVRSFAIRLNLAF